MCRRNNQSGFALILVMWVMVLLITLGTEFALSMKTEVHTTRNFKEDAEAYYLARAGIQLASAEILPDSRFHSWTGEKGFLFGPSGKKGDDQIQPNPRQPAKPGESEETLEALEPPERTEIPLSKGLIEYSISDENGKININKATREVLSKALAANGMDPGSERDAIVDSILDWIDPDDRHRANGAESDYYRGLSPSYSAKNGPMDSLEELLKVKGMTPELFYGSEEYDPEEPGGEANAPGLARVFTVQAVSQFNPNTAERAALEIMYPENQVDEILEKKEERGWYNESTSTHFKIVATGTFEYSPTRRTIVALVEKQKKDDKPVLLTRYWNDNYIRR